MFKQIKTSKENKNRVIDLTRKLNLGPENHIARIAIAYSLSQGKKLDLKNIKDSQGKEYSTNVLFGDNAPFYLAMISVHYNIYKTHKDMAKYVKLHLDHGLEEIEAELSEYHNISGFDYLFKKISIGLEKL